MSIWKVDKMKETKIFNNKTARVPVANSQLYQQPTKITGVLTSQIRSKASSDTPYMAFFRIEEGWKGGYYCSSHRMSHDLTECIASNCQECEIPVIFRIINEIHLDHLPNAFTCNFKHRELGETHWIKPNLKKGDKVLLEGKFASSDHSPRPSFTAYSYQIINHE